MSSSFDRYILKASGPSSNILETGYFWDPESLNLRPWKLLGPTKSLPCLLKPYENTFFGKRIKMIFASPEPEESTSEAIHLEKSTALQKTENHPLKSQLLWKEEAGEGSVWLQWPHYTRERNRAKSQMAVQCPCSEDLDTRLAEWGHFTLCRWNQSLDLSIFTEGPSAQFLMCRNIFLLLFSVFSLKASKAPPESESELWRLPLWAEALLKSALIESQGRPPGQGNLASQSCCCFVLRALLLRLSSSLRVCLHHWERPAECLFIENSASLGVVVHLVLDASSPVHNCVLGHIPWPLCICQTGEGHRALRAMVGMKHVSKYAVVWTAPGMC